MRTKIKEKLIEAVRAVVIEGRRDVELFDGEEELRELMRLARLHQVDHLVAYILVGKGDKRFEKFFFSSVGLTTKQSHAAGMISESFEKKKIPFIILKGQVLRRLYKEEWMRNSCDVDVLVHSEDMERAGAELLELGFVCEEGLSAHDVSYNQGKVHVELHFDLIEEHVYSEVADILSSVWERAEKRGYQYVMSDNFFYFYHVAHMAKHFENGGCGIRPILDLWLLNNRCDFDRKERDELLEKGKMLKFERQMRELADSWFLGKACEGLDVLEKYVISGGAYGRTDNSVSVKQKKRGGRGKYLISRIFAPMSLLKKYYPVLEKHPYLMPIYQVKRWIDAFLRDRKKYVSELKMNMKQNKNDDDIGRMLDDLGLSE